MIKKLDDIRYKYMSPEAQALKAELNLLKKHEGSHKSKGIREYKPRNKFGQYAELTECINEGLNNIAKGELSSDAWNRLSIKLEAWEQIPEYRQLVYKARSTIKKFEAYLEAHKNEII